MSSIDETKLQRGLIITDDISPAPILDFKSYKNAITKIIKESYPKFSIGIYGDWGSGKSTLMQSIFDQFEKENEDKKNPIILVWFNAWRYEREEHFTIIPLLKTIESKIPTNKYNTLKQAFKQAGIFGLKISKDILSGTVGNYFGKAASNLTKEGISDLIDRVIPNIEKITELEKTTIYFEGQEKIEKEIKRIREKDPDFRIVVFVDDLDRCSPEKVIEVFESIKIFLGLDGFIYVLGLSQKKISQAIKKKYEFDKEEEGDNYIKKIIQIPISLSEWNDDDVKELLNDFLSKNIIHQAYKNIIENNLELISKAVEDNPREVKRFLNNFIVAYEIFFLGNKKKANNEEAKTLLVIQAIQVRWNSFYHLLVRHGVSLCNELKNYIDLPINERMKKLESAEDIGENPDNNLKLILHNYKSNNDLWEFIREQKDVIFNINDFSPFRRAAESTKDVSGYFRSMINTTTGIYYNILSPIPPETKVLFITQKILKDITEIMLDIQSIPSPKDNSFMVKKLEKIKLSYSKFKKILSSIHIDVSIISFEPLLEFTELEKVIDEYLEEMLQLSKKENKDTELIIQTIENNRSKIIDIKSSLHVLQKLGFH